VQIAQLIVEELVAQVRGDVILPADSGYDQARRIYNGVFDAKPGAIVRCADVDDVVATINVAGASDTILAVRGGGHHVAGFGTCNDGIVLDLSGMNGVSLDVSNARVRARGGATLGHVDRKTSKVGLAVPLGAVSRTGVAGLTLSGGVGWLARRFGYTCDNLRSAVLVTAGGDVVEADGRNNAELLWGIRGGGGNFGVVVEFEFQAHSVVHGVLAEAHHVLHSGEDTARLLTFFHQYTAEMPDEVCTFLQIENYSPYFSFLPAEAEGQLLATVTAYCSGLPDEEAERLFKPLLAFGRPLVAHTTVKSHVSVQCMNDDAPSSVDGRQLYVKAEMLGPLTTPVIDAIATSCHSFSSDGTIFELESVGGAISHLDEDFTAVGLRSACYLAGFRTFFEDAAEAAEHKAWTRDAWQSALRPGSVGGVYLNFEGFEETSERVFDSLGAEKRERLVALKNAYDPTNLFRINHNIRPDLQIAAPA
jgi:hypothetical protein